MRPSPYLLALVLPLIPACSSPSSENLDVGAGLADPVMAIAMKDLGWEYNGGFTLSLSLGQLASQDTDVTVEAFSLVRTADSSSLLSPLPLGPMATTSKHVTIGTTENIVYHFSSSGGTLLDEDGMKAICSAGPVRIQGSVFDGSRGKTIPVASSAFVVTGCP
jgi:hypothetical protein